MPRNRREVDRDDKLDEILTVAEKILLAHGYDALSHSAVARELGLARAAIYWYFPAKDDLFTAAASRIFTAALANPPSTNNYARRIQWAVDRLAELRPLNLALHDRAHHSDSAAHLEATIQRGLCDRLRELLRSHVPPARLEPVTKTIVVFIEGLLAHPTPTRQRRALLQFLLTELIR